MFDKFNSYTKRRAVEATVSPISDETFRKNEELYKKDIEVSQMKIIYNNKVVQKPEVLAPAGGWPQLKAAVANGADAVYFGLQDGFNARARANNFAADELDAVMSYLHERGVRGYVAVNVLVFDNELEKLALLAKKMATSGVDALIVQDVGAIELIRKVAPNLPIHGSTQMSITDAKGASFAKSLGVERVVVGRELSIADISAVSSGCDVEIEAFVHGALCVSYSGQCFSSEAWGGRSANRGQCAQACRMPYGLIVNGTLHDMEDLKYLLSPQDLMALDLVPELISAGVGCFKIEGRLKAAEYVSLTTRAYRQAVDEAWERYLVEDGAIDKGAPVVAQVDAATRRDLSQVFARGQDEHYDGLTPGFLLGPQHQSLVRGRNPRHRGLLIGRVEGVQRPTRALKAGGVVVRVRAEAELRRGDGLVFDMGEPEAEEEGGMVYDILSGHPGAWRPLYLPGNEVGVCTGPVEGTYLVVFESADAVKLDRISIGDLVWRSKDAALDSRLRGELKAVEGGAVMANVDHLVGVQASVSGRLGTPLSITLKDTFGRTVTAQTEMLLEAAGDPMKGINTTYVSEKIGVLGGTPLVLVPSSDGEAVDFRGLEAGLFIPFSQIKKTRRQAVDELMQLRTLHTRGEGIADEEDLGSKFDNVSNPQNSFLESKERLHLGDDVREILAQKAIDYPQRNRFETSAACLSVLCRTPEQVAEVVQLPWLTEVVLDFLEAHGLREAVQLVQRAGKKCVVATPRVIKPDERRLWMFYLRLKPDALLLRSAGLLQQLNELGGAGATVFKDEHGGGSDHVIPELRGDFSLNAANAISAASFLQNGLSRLAPTHDLNAHQICDLARALSPAQLSSFEVLIHQHLPIFHTEHCVFCRFLSDGNSYRDCGKPCESNSVSLRDMHGADHLVLADMGCRNTVFNAQAQSGAKYITNFLEAGIRLFRIELVDEPGNIARDVLEQYHSVFQSLKLENSRAETDVESLWRWLATVPNAYGSIQGVSAGSLLPTEEKDRSLLKPTARRA